MKVYLSPHRILITYIPNLFFRSLLGSKKCLPYKTFNKALIIKSDKLSSAYWLRYDITISNNKTIFTFLRLTVKNNNKVIHYLMDDLVCKLFFTFFYLFILVLRSIYFILCTFLILIILYVSCCLIIMIFFKPLYNSLLFIFMIICLSFLNIILFSRGFRALSTLTNVKLRQNNHDFLEILYLALNNTDPIIFWLNLV
jgi:hypothetical protein